MIFATEQTTGIVQSKVSNLSDQCNATDSKREDLLGASAPNSKLCLEEKIMKTNFFKFVGRLTFLIIGILMFGQIAVSAQEPMEQEGIKAASSDTQSFAGDGARALEGTWQVQTTIRNCQTGTVLESFSKLTSFNMGGTTQDTSSSSLFRSVGLGLWEHTGKDSFRYLSRFFRFNPDGTPAGSVRALWNVAVDGSSDTYEAAATVQIVAPNGTVVNTVCGSETAARLVFPD